MSKPTEKLAIMQATAEKSAEEWTWTRHLEF